MTTTSSPQANSHPSGFGVLLVVAREGSFTRAAAKLGVSQSALSQTVRALEERILNESPKLSNCQAALSGHKWV